MTSGIYKLTFPSGRIYIGKSVDMDNRWRQHFDKFKKGTAAKDMQYEYDTYGKPVPEVIYKCHPDHLDIMESFFISRVNPELNTSRPADPFGDLINEDVDDVTKWLHYSTIKLTQFLNEYEDKIHALVEANDEAKGTIDDLCAAIERKIEEADILGRIKAKDQQIDQLEEFNHSLYTQLQEAKKPWWKKLF